MLLVMLLLYVVALIARIVVVSTQSHNLRFKITVISLYHRAIVSAPPDARSASPWLPDDRPNPTTSSLHHRRLIIISPSHRLSIVTSLYRRRITSSSHHRFIIISLSSHCLSLLSLLLPLLASSTPTPRTILNTPSEMSCPYAAVFRLSPPLVAHSFTRLAIRSGQSRLIQ